MGPKKRSPVAMCGIGCVGFFGLALVVFAVWFGMAGRYMPRIAPLRPLPPVNAFDDYVATGRMLKANGGTRAMYGPNGSGPPILANEKQVVAQNRAALARLRLAFGKPCRAPLSRNVNELFPYLADFRDIARLLSAEADVKQAAGDYAGAFSAGIDGIQMGQDVMRGGILIHALVGVAIQAIVQYPMVRAVDKLSAKDCARLIDRLQSLLLTRYPTVEVVKEERNYTLQSLASMRADAYAQDWATSNEEDPGSTSAKAKRAFNAIGWHFQRDKTLKAMERYYDEVQREMAKPRAERKPVAEPPGLAGMFVVDFDTTDNRLDEVDMRNRMFLCAAAIRGYRLKHGKLPASLRDLGLNASMLRDPYSNGDFVYQQVNDGYFLYSVGRDGRDDNGVPVDESQEPHGPGDLGMRRFDARPDRVRTYRLVPHMNTPKLPPGTPAPPP